VFAAATGSGPAPTSDRRGVESTGFDAAPARAPELKTAAAVVGTFDHATATAARPGTDRPSGTTDAGFGSVAAGPRTPAPRGSVAEAGFGAAGGSGGSRGGGPAKTEIRTGSFDIQAAPVSTSNATRNTAVRVDEPVSILFKPTPAYTDEARALKLEGDVVLEVEFSAARQVRVLRVVRGMGHGLDESAARAAEQIQFKPAQARGRPVDFRATLHIVFRLT
jgi:TonB family protein